MRIYIGSTSIRSIVLGLVAVGIFGFGQKAARADEVTIVGVTTDSRPVVGLPQLIFLGNIFTGTTALGVGSLSGSNSLGTFLLSTAPTQALSGTFSLNIIFPEPTGINGGRTTSYIATITGSVSPNVDQGGVFIHFIDPTQTFTFNNGTSVGTFSLTLADLFVQTGNPDQFGAGRPANLTAGITGNQTPIPEPTTLLLLGTGLTGVATKLRQRSRTRKEAA